MQPQVLRCPFLVSRRNINQQTIEVQVVLHSIVSTSFLQLKCVFKELTGDYQSSFRRTQSCLSCQSMLCAALVGLVAIFGTHVPNVQLSRRQHQIFTIQLHRKITSEKNILIFPCRPHILIIQAFSKKANVNIWTTQLFVK